MRHAQQRTKRRANLTRETCLQLEINFCPLLEKSMKLNQRILSRLLPIAAASSLLFAGQQAMATITIPIVTVGNVGNVGDTVVAYGGSNPNDLTTGLGAVNYAYGIGKYEVTAGQYTAFLNSVAQTDTFGVYAPQMANTAYSGITRSGTSGTYTYSVADPLRPAQFVSFWSAARFVNWMHNGQTSGLQGPGTTETGSYTLTPGGIAANSVARNASATWVIPTENEWYKAAYYNAGASNYWAYPTQSNTLPGNVYGDPNGNNANLAGSTYPVPIFPGHYTTTVGSFINSQGPYGTYDMAGNVAEWNEGFTPLTSSGGGTGRGLRGGTFGDDDAGSAYRSLLLGVPPTYSAAVSGFRVALVPEPGSSAMLVAGLLALGAFTRRKLRT
jgi:formylglycine-generating enzyme